MEEDGNYLWWSQKLMYKGMLWKFARLTLATALFVLAVRAQAQTGQAAKTATVFLDGIFPNADRVREIVALEAEQDHAAAVCFWEEKTKIPVSCEATGQSSRVSVIVTAGNPEAAFPGSGTLIWQKDACLLDRETSQLLFGTADAEGQRLVVGERACYVKQTFAGAKRMLICGNEMEDTEFSRLSLGFADERKLAEQAGQFLLRYGLSGTVLDLSFLQAMTRNLLLLFPAGIAWKLFRRLYAGHALATKSASLLFLGAVACLLAGLAVFPADMIPTRWSDFSFWGRWWDGQRQNLLQILTFPIGEPNLSLLLRMLQSGVCSLGAFFVTVQPMAEL